MNISPLTRTFSAVAGSLGLMGIVYAFSGNLKAMGIVLAGTIFVVGLLLTYQQILRQMQKRRANPFTRGIIRNSAASPNAISEPGRRAKLDELRKSFETGIEKFKAAGKDLYTLPWYVLVGEPSAGKTEAIRRCNVGFPQGLQEYTQGAGGTLNMNWWFTNHAIIIDTAGRMMFEEVVPGASSEFKEFLRLLTVSRVNCPINGMLLVIPADSLIKDSADVIEKKAGKIAQQLDLIQRTLGVRFPVFAVVTKCDLINGFREFFEGLDNPQLQHQMLGWSNPAPLDAVFNPEMVDQHLESVRQRLLRRRYSLLLDPVNTDDSQASRLDQVDALFTFPDSLLNIAPRLRRYMEMIFVAGEWSPKPLFLRGIYFTSSMREGSALDAELADILKVPVDSLQERKVWERERAYFLRDLFTKKVFKEKGLVTRAGDPKRQQRRRSLALIGVGFAAAAILFALTIVGAYQFRRSIGEHVSFWSALNDQYHDWALVEHGPGYPLTSQYGGTRSIDAADVGSVGQLLTNVPKRVTDPIHIPKVFEPVALFDRSVTDDLRRDAYGVVYETSGLEPVIASARAKMDKIDATADSGEAVWNDKASAALVELVRLEADAARPKDSTAVSGRFDLDPVMRFVLPDKGYEAYLLDERKKSVDPLVWLYQPGTNTRQWPPASLVASVASQQALRTGVRKFDQYWSARVNGATPLRQAIGRLAAAVGDFAAAQAAAAKTAGAMPGTTTEYTAYHKAWEGHRQKLEKASAVIDAALADIAALPGGWPDGMTLSALAAGETARINADSKTAYATLKEAATPISWLRIPAVAQGTGDAADLATAEAYVAPVPGEAATTMASTTQAVVRRYQVLMRVYRDAANRVTRADGESPTVASANVAATLVGAANVDDSGVKNALASTGQGAARETWTNAAAAAGRYRLYALIDAVLPKGKIDADGIAQMVATAGDQSPTPVPEAIAGTKFDGKAGFAPQFAPNGAKTVLGAFAAPRPYLQGESSNVIERAALAQRFADTQAACRDYAGRYLTYWGHDVVQMAAYQPDDKEKWESFFAADQKFDAARVNDALEHLFATAAGAVDAVKGFAAGDEKASEAAALLSGDLQMLRQGQLRENSARLVLTWRQRGEVQAARDAILKMEPAAFATDFLLASGGDEQGPGKYWSDFGRHRLALLAAAWRGSAAGDFDKNIRPFDVFPLAPHRIGQLPLSEAQVNQATVAIRDFLRAQQPGSDPSARTIGEGAALGGVPGNTDLESLRTPFVPPEDPQWFTKVNAVLSVLNSRNGNCNVSLLNRGRRDRLLVSARAPDDNWSDMILQQGGSGGLSVAGQVRLKDAPAEDLAVGSVAVRGDKSVVMQFTRTPNGPVEEVKEFPSPWAGIEMLHLADEAMPVASNAKKWEVELMLGQGVQRRALWLTVEFSGDLPSMQSWPALRKR